MHDIEPHYKWRHHYVAAEDKLSPFYGRTYDEFRFTKKIYNYFIHPQWDEFGSTTLYSKILFVDYKEGYTIIELIGEWNDCLQNDVMFLKRRLIDHLSKNGVHKFIILCENVLNFHGSDDCYYEEWYEDVAENDGWITFLNTLDHVMIEMKENSLHHFINFGEEFNHLNWRPQKPSVFFQAIDSMVQFDVKRLT